MMLEELKELLKEAGTDAWEITDLKTLAYEFYFIRHRLDQNRIRDTRHVTLKVYRRFDGFMGSASAEVMPGSDREAMKKLIGELQERALLIRNPEYTVNPAAKHKDEEQLPEIGAIARDFIEVMRDLPETETEDINSYEIFTAENTRRFITSAGTDVTMVYPSASLEVVVNARQERQEIELYRMYTSGTCDREMLKKEISRTLQTGRDKLRAESTPELGTCDVVFSTDAALQIYEYFLNRVNARMKYQGISDISIGDEVVPGMAGDRLSASATRYLPNSSANRSYDSEGAPVRDLTLIRDGIAENFWGARQYACYLGLDNTFIPGNFTVSGGTRTEAQLRQGRYLEVVEFSDFQVSPFNGDMAGEIRLAYYHDGEKVRIVSGGSVSGSVRELAAYLCMSVNQVQYDRMLVPAVLRLSGVTVTGIAG
ncbi:MAG: TldD/PmbA family protein [Solobacterium sp.]|nr:TldD/PmbA family protein [Solobacterium sp.]MBQ6356355.1 TldD/PmbA family protein [Solobacterium sp.]